MRQQKSTIGEILTVVAGALVLVAVLLGLP